MSTTPLDRVDAHNPCLICGKGSRGGCFRQSGLHYCRHRSDGAIRTTTNGVYVHRRGDDRILFRRDRGFSVRTDSATDFAARSASYIGATLPNALECFAGMLGVTADALQRMRCGWAHDQQIRNSGPLFDPGDFMRSCGNRNWGAPMCDENERVIGIRIRSESGAKWSVEGSREGLFIPTGIDFKNVVITEGFTDTPALLDLGFNAIGRAHCGGNIRQLCELCRKHQTQSVVIFGDGDGSGRRGAESLAATLRVYAPVVKLVFPPAGVKDARAWVNSGATSDDVQSLIDATEQHGLEVRYV